MAAALHQTSEPADGLRPRRCQGKCSDGFLPGKIENSIADENPGNASGNRAVISKRSKQPDDPSIHCAHTAPPSKVGNRNDEQDNRISHKKGCNADTHQPGQTRIHTMVHDAEVSEGPCRPGIGQILRPTLKEIPDSHPVLNDDKYNNAGRDISHGVYSRGMAAPGDDHGCADPDPPVCG